MLVLFDIDGTLVHARGAGVRSMEQVGIFENLFEAERAGVHLFVETKKFLAQILFRRRHQHRAPGNLERRPGSRAFGNTGNQRPEEDACVFFEMAADKIPGRVKQLFEIRGLAFEPFHPERFNRVQVAVARKRYQRVFRITAHEHASLIN